MTTRFPCRMEVTAHELARHAGAGPRYTSYPPATQFSSDFGAADARAHFAALERAPQDEPLAVYVHVPFCSELCWYCGCNVTVTRARDRGTEFVRTLSDEIEQAAGGLGARKRVVDIALGGGSPNFLRPVDLVSVVGAINRWFAVDRDAEMSIELDARDTPDALIDVIAELGFNRLSLGVQDFHPEVQQAIHREQSVGQTRGVIEHARKRGISRVNVDLVYGLPLQTTERLVHTVDEVVDLRPNRVALFGYAHLPHLRPHQKLVERAGPIPGIAERAELLSAAMARLDAAGYVRVGLDHYVLPDDELLAAAASGDLHRNFQGYVVQRAEHLLGFGPSAISDVAGAYWQNDPDVAGWSNRVTAGVLPVARGVRLEADDFVRGFVIDRLMCDGEIGFDAFEERFGVDFAEYFAAELAQLASGTLAELVDIDLAGGRLVATPLGCHFIRSVCMVFDAYRAPDGGDPPKASPTI